MTLIFSLDSIDANFTCGDVKLCFPESWERYHLWPVEQYVMPPGESLFTSMWLPAERSIATDLHAIRVADNTVTGLNWDFGYASEPHSECLVCEQDADKLEPSDLSREISHVRYLLWNFVTLEMVSSQC